MNAPLNPILGPAINVSIRPKTCAVAQRCCNASQGGFSLVELLIAVAIGMLLLTGLVSLFANNSSARNELEKSNRQIENGRYALQYLQDEIHHAGYYGTLATAPVLSSGTTSLPDPCVTTLATVKDAMALPVQGYAGAANANALHSGKLACLDSAAGYKANTAVIVVRRANTAVTGFTSGVFNIQVSSCAGDSVAYVLDTVAANFTLHKNTSPGCTPITSATTASITTYYNRIFFVSTCSGTDCSATGADSTPTLKRIDLTSTGTTITPIVDGIDNLQFDYGIDSNGDGAPDAYTNTTAHSAAIPSSIAEWGNVMSVKIHVLARNVDSTAGYVDPKTYQVGSVSATPADAFKRHAYAGLVRINNPAGRRE